MDEINQAFFTFSTSEGEVYFRITCSGSYGVIQKVLMEHTMDDRWHESCWFQSFDEYIKRILLQYVLVSTFGIYCQWVMDPLLPL